jgi:hypothetical protein
VTRVAAADGSRCPIDSALLRSGSPGSLLGLVCLLLAFTEPTDEHAAASNPDHIVVGPRGIFTIKTKSHGGRLTVSILSTLWLKQAYAQRKVIEEITGEQVDCLLVFSRAWLSTPVSDSAA